ncbi:TonB-dependent receptor domain-containing protein [Motilimonas cestriensis]|uniref:TonB-dependent receptor domain-containing protein n=1 Tax=Motilimonas cestriensis TaxID=2742685 RepID=UPI003DA1FFEC
MKKTLLAVALTPLCLPYATAKNIAEDDTIIVTANRTEQPLASSLASVAVIEKEEIEAIQAKSFAEVLRRLPGIQVNEGGFGQQTDIFVRGSSSKHILLLINGVRIGSATTGSANFGQIPLTGIERIEFVRGPRAAIYGSDAMGGVINVITSYQGEEYGELSTSLGSREFSSIETAAAAALKDDAWVKFAVKHDNAEGFSAQKAPVDQDKDGFHNTSFVAELGKQFSQQWRASLQGYFQQGQSDYDSAWAEDTYSETENYNVAGKLNYQGEWLFGELTLATNQDKSDDYSATSHDVFKTNRDLVNLLVSAAANEAVTITSGVEWYQDEVGTDSAAYAKSTRDNKAIYINLDYQLAPLSIEASARLDDNQSYGSKTTWQLATGYQVAEQVRLLGSIGTAFKAPTFNDLYYPESPYSKGNPKLKPEQSLSYDLGAEVVLDSVDFRFTAYQSEIEDLIIWPAPNYYMPENVSEAEIKGLEIQAEFATGALNHQLSYDHVNAKDKKTNKYLPRRARHLAKWNLNYRYQDLQFDVTTLYQGDSYDNAANTNKLKGYFLADLATSYYFSNGLVLRGRIANLFDKEYEVKKNYNTAERSYYVTGSYRF